MLKIKQFFSMVSYVLAIFCLTLSVDVFAKTITLYDLPKANAKSIGSINLSTGIVPIFTTQAGDWVKVGDPDNGNVGWVKSSDLNQGGKSVSFSQRILMDETGPKSYQIFINGQAQKVTPAEAQSMMQKLQLQQKNMQEYIQNMVRDMNTFYKNQAEMFNAAFPFISPVVVIPDRQPVVMDPLIAPKATPVKK